MRSLAKAISRRGETGEALPCPIRAIEGLGFHQRRGQLSLWVAGPGVGKSAIALFMFLRMGVPGLYVSADTDSSDQGERAAAILTGDTVDAVTWAFENDQADKYKAALAGMDPRLRFEFDTAPGPADLVEMCKAYGMTFGEWPSLVIVDTLGKIWNEAGDEHSRNKEAVDKCQQIARETGAHVMVLHHAVKGYDSGDRPIPLDGLMSGVSKIPEQVMTMFKDGAGRIAFCPVKNRSGPMDPTAMQLRGWALVDLSRMTISEIQPVMPVEPWRDPEFNQ